MPSKSQENKQVNLELVENHSKTFCHHCGSSKYHKKGRKAGKQRYLCLVCRRYFGDDFDYVNCKPNPLLSLLQENNPGCLQRKTFTKNLDFRHSVRK